MFTTVVSVIVPVTVEYENDFLYFGWCLIYAGLHPPAPPLKNYLLITYMKNRYGIMSV